MIHLVASNFVSNGVCLRNSKMKEHPIVLWNGDVFLDTG